MLVNRIGDFALLLAIFTIYLVFNSLDYDVIFNIIPSFINYTINISTFNFFLIDIICVLLFLGAMGKSAQFGLHI